MADRGIIFSAPMVRALLDGRKTQTRRLLKPMPFVDGMGNFCTPDRKGKIWNWGQHFDGTPCTRNFVEGHVHYAKGDRLYVREAWAPLSECTHNDPGVQAFIDKGFFRADESTVDGEIRRWRPSIHMPRWASRLWLLVTDVRVQRLQDCSAEDAIAEGIKLHRLMGAQGWYDYGDKPGDMTRRYFSDPRPSYRTLWNSLHTAEGERWEDNPWVAAVSFEVKRGNIDAEAP